METSSSKAGRALAFLLVSLVIAGAWLPPVQTVADAQIDAGLKRALVAFAAARTLNAAISVAQGTEVGVQVGVGMTLTLGQALDPVNDLVEQFASLMLMASVAFGVQKALLAIGGHGWCRWRSARRPSAGSRCACAAARPRGYRGCCWC